MSLYHFIGVAERFDESLVVMKHLFNLTMSDILYVSSKVSGQDGLPSHKPFEEEKPKVGGCVCVDGWVCVRGWVVVAVAVAVSGWVGGWVAQARRRSVECGVVV